MLRTYEKEARSDSLVDAKAELHEQYWFNRNHDNVSLHVTHLDQLQNHEIKSIICSWDARSWHVKRFLTQASDWPPISPQSTVESPSSFVSSTRSAETSLEMRNEMRKSRIQFERRRDWNIADKLHRKAALIRSRRQTSRASNFCREKKNFH